MKKPKSTVKGVSWSSRHQKWLAQYQPKRKYYFGGYHKKLKDAIAAREKLLKDYGPVYKPIVLKIKKHTSRAVCRVLRCTSKCEGRGLCQKHYKFCAYRGLLEMYGVPPYRGSDHIYKINKKAEPDECRIIKDEEICENKIYTRGLCHRHYNKYHRDGRLDKFALPPHANPKRAIGVRDYDYDNN